MTFPVVSGEVLAQLLPLFLLVFAGCVFLMWGAASSRFTTAHSTIAALFFVGLLALVVYMWGNQSWPLLGGMLVVDKFALFFTGVVGASAPPQRTSIVGGT